MLAIEKSIAIKGTTLRSPVWIKFIIEVGRRKLALL